MNRLLRLSAAALSTLLLATGANGLVKTNTDCPVASDNCTTADCTAVSGNCSGLNSVDIQGLVDQCNSNTEVLKALIENGNCSSDDLKCLISDGTCTVDEVCTALENCDSGCEDIQSIIDDVSCVSDGSCVNDTDECPSDVNVIKSILDNVAAKSNDDCVDCDKEVKNITECTDCDKEVKGVTDCADVKTVVKVIKSDCTASDTEAENKKTESTVEIEKCTSDCDTESDTCANGDCEENKTCENGNCDSDVLKEELSKYGIDINDCIVNGNCGNGKYTVTYGNYEDIEDILKSWGVYGLNTESKPTENNNDTQSKPDDNKTDTQSKPNTESKPETASKPAAPSVPKEDNSSSEAVSDSGVSEYEKRVAELVNVERAKYGLPALKLNTELSAVARLKSQDMRDKNYFSHTSPTYGSPFDMMKKFGISYRTAGENIARGQRTPEEVVNGWMNSEGHRANILNSSFTEIGVGYVADGNYWTQMFIS